MIGAIHNPSYNRVMRATLDEQKHFHVPPRGTMPVLGRVQWERWKLEWEEPPPKPRKGLMRFGFPR